MTDGIGRVVGVLWCTIKRLFWGRPGSLYVLAGSPTVSKRCRSRTMDKGSTVLVLYWSRVPMGAVGQDTALADPAWPVYTHCVRAWRSEIAAREALDYWTPAYGSTRASHLSQRSATGGSGHSKMCSLAPSKLTPTALFSPRRSSVSAASPSPRSAYRYLNGRLATAVALSIMPDTVLRQSRSSIDRAKSMLLVSAGVKVFSNPRDGVLAQPGRSSRVQQSLTESATQDLGTTPPQAKEARRYG
jgi:hypothetical protein